MTQRRALALNAVLENCKLSHVPGELLIGAGFSGLRVQPNVFHETEVREARELLAQIGERSFQAHASHHSLDYTKLLSVGLAGLQMKAEKCLSSIGEGKLGDFLHNVIIALNGVREHLRRWSRFLEERADEISPFAGLYSFQADQMNRLPLY